MSRAVAYELEAEKAGFTAFQSQWEAARRISSARRSCEECATSRGHPVGSLVARCGTRRGAREKYLGQIASKRKRGLDKMNEAHPRQNECSSRRETRYILGKDPSQVECSMRYFHSPGLGRTLRPARIGSWRHTRLAREPEKQTQPPEQRL